MIQRFLLLAAIRFVVATHLVGQPTALLGQPAAPLGQPAAAMSPADRSDATFRDDFRDALGSDWQWLRENKAGWRVSDEGLKVLIEPGNMWGGANDAKNVLLRRVPDGWDDAVQVCAELSHKPEKRWEQADLVWYYSDRAMVKIGLEIEHGETNIVMGREERDKTKTLAIIPYADPAVQLRLSVHGNEIHGDYRRLGSTNWVEAGHCTLPKIDAPETPYVSLQFYQGESDSNRWATVNWIEITHVSGEHSPQ
ncbi:beta-xylosidase family glycoside hydrolase [Novipirellula artificiosorum]|uniref:Beta-xylosidase C-terminal Concanavalin A-like domain-containing protein n=1 Tax=Novipirellula artificiosorum TaxID=2528016 RepID=A0A5C6DWJ6_9BACT|nr:hypothetical protein [Novipirellula artificiosorum]TWU41110.1 hypothetical protein Poly41_19480 [Novipirellula artificiosorum]